MEPASAAPPTTPKASARRSGGTSETASAMPMGTVPPPPMAWITRAPIIHSKLGATATRLVPMQNTISDAW